MKSIRIFIVAFAVFVGFQLFGINWKAVGASQAQENDSSFTERESLLEELRKVREVAEHALTEARLARSEAQSLRTELDGMRSDSPPAQAAASPNVQSGERLTRLEEQIEINSERIREQAQSKVESDSRFPVRVSGILLANFHHNSDDIQRSEPLFAPSPVIAPSGGTFGSTFRQTRLGLAINGPKALGGRTSGEIEFDFYGGTVGQVEGDVLGALRIRTASVRLDWDRSSLVVGQEAPLISPRNPTSIAAVWYPPLSGAGNLWQWRPQITYEHRFRSGEKAELIAQGGYMAPFGESYSGLPTRGSPAVEGRFAFRQPLDEDRAIEVGFGAHFESRSFDYGRSVDGYVASGDWMLPIGSRFEISGEMYHGRSITLSEQSGGRIDRAFAVSGPVDNPYSQVLGVRSSGGWLQFTTRARHDLEFNVAYGQEDPNNSDLRFGAVTDFTRFKNQVGSVNVIYQLRPNFLISLEYRRLVTDFNPGRSRNNHVNLAFGYVF